MKANAFALGITTSVSQDPLKYPQPIDIHLHLPSGAVKKDGPSAGVAYVCAFVSLLTGLTVPTTVAMTGETTLRGKVTAVGGIKEKVSLCSHLVSCKLTCAGARRSSRRHTKNYLTKTESQRCRPRCPAGSYSRNGVCIC